MNILHPLKKYRTFSGKCFIIIGIVLWTPYFLSAQGLSDFRKQVKAEPDQAFETGLNLLHHTDSTVVSIELAEVLDYLSYYSEYHLFKMKDAIRYSERALRIYTELNRPHQAEATKVTLGRLHISQGNYHEAFRYIEPVIHRLEKSGDTLQLRECYLMMEKIDYSYYHDYKRALRFNNRITYSDTRAAAYQKARALNQYLVYPVSREQMDSLLTECKSICTQHGFYSNLVYAYLNCCLLTITMNEYEDSKKYLDESVQYLQNFKDSGYYFATSGFYHIYTEDKDQGIEDLKTSISLLERGDFDTKNLYSFYYLQELYFQDGKYREAYETLNRYFQIYSQLNNRETVQELSRSLYSTQMKSIEETHQKENQKKTFILLFLSLIILFLIILAIQFMSKQKIKLKAALLQKEKQEYELKQKEELIRIQKLQQCQENQLIDHLITEIYNANEKKKAIEIKSDLFHIIRKLNESRDKSGWSELETSSEGTCTQFFEKLLQEHPDLTPNERRLCSLIHMNLSTKEISNITHQSINSINTARTRLRKKLNLTGDDKSLVAYFDKFDF